MRKHTFGLFINRSFNLVNSLCVRKARSILSIKWTTFQLFIFMFMFILWVFFLVYGKSVEFGHASSHHEHDYAILYSQLTAFSISSTKLLKLHGKMNPLRKESFFCTVYKVRC